MINMSLAFTVYAISKLLNLPGLFSTTPVVSNFESCFAGQGSVNSSNFPSGIFNNCIHISNLTNCFKSNMFGGDQVTTWGGTADPLWTMFPSVPHDRCFYWCYLLSNYNNIPDDWKL